MRSGLIKLHHDPCGRSRGAIHPEEDPMSTYKVIEIIGSSSASWEEAAKNAILEAAKSIRHLRVAEVDRLDVNLSDNGQVLEYRARLKVSIKHETD